MLLGITSQGTEIYRLVKANMIGFETNNMALTREIMQVKVLGHPDHYCKHLGPRTFYQASMDHLFLLYQHEGTNHS